MAELQKLLAEKLAEVIDETLENMAFISTEEVDPAQTPLVAEDMRAVILLTTAPVVMEIRLDMAEDLLRRIVETMYTIDAEDITQEQIIDVLAETLNTLAGRLMTELLPPEQAFSLSLPETVVTELDSADDNTVFATRFIADGLPINVKISASTPQELKDMFKAHPLTLQTQGENPWGSVY